MDENRDQQLIRKAFEASLSSLQDNPCLAARVLRAAKEEENNTMRLHLTRKAALRFTLTLLCILTLTVAAMAAVRPPVLDWLLGNAPANQALSDAAMSLSTQTTADGITVRITGIVFDGQQLAFSYALENADPAHPVLVAADDIMTIGGHEVRLQHCTADPSAPQMVPSPHLDVLPVQRNPAMGGGMTGRIGTALSGTVTGEITFTVYRPEAGYAFSFSPNSMLANADAFTGDAHAEAVDSLNTIHSFTNAVILQDGEVAPAGYVIIDEGGMITGNAKALHESTRITVPFTFEASGAFACDFSGAPDQPLEGGKLHVEHFRLSTLETLADIRLIPSENTQSAARALAERYGDCALTDGAGNPVVYSEMDYMSGFSPDIIYTDGQWLCRYQLAMPGLMQYPEQIAFTAGGETLLCFSLTADE